MKLERITSMMKDRKPGDIGKRKNCSVLIPLVELDGELHILYEQRSSKLKTQPGDICFPGGVMEPDETPIETAVRETYEEIGIAPEHIQILGQFETIYDVRGLTMHTVIGVVDPEAMDHLTLNPAEVAEVFTVPFDFFNENNGFIYEHDVIQKVDDFPYEKAGVNPNYKWRVGRATIPVYHYGEGEARKVIWGLTAMITLWLKQKLEEFERK